MQIRLKRASLLGMGRGSLCLLLLAGLAACNDDAAVRDASSAAAPAISGTPVAQARVGQKWSFTPTLSSGFKGVGFSVSHKPRWASFNTTTGQLAGTPTKADVGTYPNVVISASDGRGSAALRAFTITVAAGGTVTLDWQAPKNNTDGSPLTDLAGYTIDYGTDASVLDQSVTIDSPSTTSYTLQNLSSGVWYFTVSAYTSDGAQSDPTGAVSTTVD